jgi:hypothetical protein
MERILFSHVCVPGARWKGCMTGINLLLAKIHAFFAKWKRGPFP